MLGCISIGSQVLGRCWHCEVPKHGEVPKQPWFGCSNAWLKVSLLEGAFVGKSIGSKASNPKEISPILHKFPHSNSHKFGVFMGKKHTKTPRMAATLRLMLRHDVPHQLWWWEWGAYGPRELGYWFLGTLGRGPGHGINWTMILFVVVIVPKMFYTVFVVA